MTLITKEHLPDGKIRYGIWDEENTCWHWVIDG
jgi:hypothetical protein